MAESSTSGIQGDRIGLTVRLVAAALAALAALAVPSLARAGGVPPQLLAQAQANPNQTFDVIVETRSDSGRDPSETAVGAMTDKERKELNKAAKDADKAQKKLLDLAKKVDKAREKLAKAQEKAADATAKANQTGKQDDLEKAAKEQGKVDEALADLQGAQADLDAAQADAVQTQQEIAQAQGELVAATERARGSIRWRFQILPAVNATLTGSQIVEMNDDDTVLAVTPNVKVRSTGNGNSQKWVNAVQADWYWRSHQRKDSLGVTPTIAVVDSGVDASHVADFGGRLLAQIDLVSGAGPNSPGDGRGHGTMVASIAAGGADRRTGVNPDARLVSLDVIDDNGEGRVADVIAAADWILQNRFAYNIRVANFSLQASTDSSFMYDPLSAAVERLWFNGVVVVAAAGNYASGGAESGVRYAPASDPFVITVGALDTAGTDKVRDDVAAPWSAWGHTHDGFRKPEISAPGRYMIGAIPFGSSLAAAGGQNSRLVPEGYLQLSGTSFAAPVISGAAAALLGLHPDWNPDQVKGALMASASPLPAANPGAVGAGELDLKSALDVAAPPNPNEGLNRFVAATSGGLVFDSASWSSTAKSNASWSSASWSSASWSSASWSSASWSSASWSSASWSSASWASSASEAGLAFVDNAAADGYGEG